MIKDKFITVYEYFWDCNDKQYKACSTIKLLIAIDHIISAHKDTSGYWSILTTTGRYFGNCPKLDEESNFEQI